MLARPEETAVWEEVLGRKQAHFGKSSTGQVGVTPGYSCCPLNFQWDNIRCGSVGSSGGGHCPYGLRIPSAFIIVIIEDAHYPSLDFPNWFGDPTRTIFAIFGLGIIITVGGDISVL